MLRAQRRRLESKGWKIGTTRHFLALTSEEQTYLELRLSLVSALKKRRMLNGQSHAELARAIRSSASRVARMGAGDSSIPVDLMFRSLIALGASNKDLAEIVSGSRLRRSARA